MLGIEQVGVVPDSLDRGFFIREPAEVELIAGDKRLIIGFIATRGIIMCDTRTFPDGPRIPGATTLVYKRALQLMQQAADILQKPLRFDFVTSHPLMRAWALDPDKGLGVFNWDETDCRKSLVANKIIYPNCSSSTS